MRACRSAIASRSAPFTPESSARVKLGSSGTVSPRPKALNAAVSWRRRPANRRPARCVRPSESTSAPTAAADSSPSDRRSGPSSDSRGTAMPTVNRDHLARLNAV